jgi:CPA1 family monovalent cation:H+ antiporter
LSGVLVIGTGAIILSQRSSIRMPAGVRVPSYAVWEAMVFFLNALAFILAGLQVGPTLDRLGRGHYHEYFLFAGAILVTVIVTGIGWDFSTTSYYGVAQRILGSRAPRAVVMLLNPVEDERRENEIVAGRIAMLRAALESVSQA